MATTTVENVLEEARSHLGDVDVAGGEEFTDAVLLPHFKDGWRKLYRAVQANGIPLGEKTWSTTLAIGATELTPPSDMGQPYKVEERLNGSSDDWTEVVPAEELLAGLPNTSLDVYEWTEGKIVTRGATTTRAIKVSYMASPDSPTTGAIAIDDCSSFLAKWTAASAFRSRDTGNLAQQLRADAEAELAEWVSVRVRQMQGTRYRRRPFGSHR
jgi:hypothetical protein